MFFQIINKDLSARIVTFLFAIFSFWWIFLNIQPENVQPIWREYFSAGYGLIALIGGMLGLFISKSWGWTKSVMGKSVMFFSVGLLLQEFGQLSYSAYTFLFHIEVPYPSLGDIGYFGSIPAYIMGVYYLARASGVKISVKSYRNKIWAFLIPVFMLSFSYVVFLRNYEFNWDRPLVIFLDFGYPLGQAVYVSMAILTYLLSRKVLGGIMKSRVLFILFALVMQYVADYVFLYKFQNRIWETAGINEYMYLVTYFLMTLGLIQLKTAFEEIRDRT